MPTMMAYIQQSPKKGHKMNDLKGMLTTSTTSALWMASSKPTIASTFSAVPSLQPSLQPQNSPSISSAIRNPSSSPSSDNNTPTPQLLSPSNSVVCSPTRQKKRKRSHHRSERLFRKRLTLKSLGVVLPSSGNDCQRGYSLPLEPLSLTETKRLPSQDVLTLHLPHVPCIEKTTAARVKTNQSRAFESKKCLQKTKRLPSQDVLRFHPPPSIDQTTAVTRSRTKPSKSLESTICTASKSNPSISAPRAKVSKPKSSESKVSAASKGSASKTFISTRTPRNFSPSSNVYYFRHSKSRSTIRFSTSSSNNKKPALTQLKQALKSKVEKQRENRLTKKQKRRVKVYAPEPNAGQEVEEIEMNTGSLYLYRGGDLPRRAVFILY